MIDQFRPGETDTTLSQLTTLPWRVENGPSARGTGTETASCPRRRAGDRARGSTHGVAAAVPVLGAGSVVGGARPEPVHAGNIGDPPAVEGGRRLSGVHSTRGLRARYSRR